MYFVVIDAGTSSTRAILFDIHGRIQKQVAYTLKSYYPETGWVEQSPEELWANTLKALREVCAGLNPKFLLSLGITNQRETTILWDKKTGKNLGPAIVWQDRRTQEDCLSFEENQDLIYQKTGLKCDPYFSASKIRWILKQYADYPREHIAFGTVDSYLLWQLSHGQHRTDITNASRSLLFNIHTQAWDDELLELFDIPSHILPEVLDSDAHFADLHPSILGASIPIHAILGDQQAALVGISALEAGDVKITYGTGGFVMKNTGQECFTSQDLITTIAYRIQNQTHYALEGPIYDAGSMMTWLKDQLHLFSDYAEIETLLQASNSNEGVYFIPAFSGIAAPHWFSEVGASFVGLSRRSHKVHLIRAVLESLIYQTQDILIAMTSETGLKLRNIKVDGGMAHQHWLLQFLADLSRLTVKLPNTLENTAKGVAMVLALQHHKTLDLKQLSQSWQAFSMIEPNPHLQHQISYQSWQKELAHVMNKSVTGFQSKNHLG